MVYILYNTHTATRMAELLNNSSPYLILSLSSCLDTNRLILEIYIRDYISYNTF
jgi:hypothetical protein